MRKIRKKKLFRKTLKKYQKNIKVLEELDQVVELLVTDSTIPQKYNDHELTGKFKGIRELHLFPDDLLMYFKVTDNELVLVAIGSHSDLFG